jgi:hypothetical protein
MKTGLEMVPGITCGTEVWIETTNADGTYVGTEADGITTKVVDLRITTVLTEVGTKVAGMRTGEFGNKVTGGKEAVNTSFEVTVYTVKTWVDGIVWIYCGGTQVGSCGIFSAEIIMSYGCPGTVTTTTEVGK